MYPAASIINHSCMPNTACVAEGHRLVFETLRPISVGEELVQCYVLLDDASASGDAEPEGAACLSAYGRPDPTAPWGFACACERCDGSATTASLERFDAAHKCACGGIVLPKMKAAADAAAGGAACRCHTHNFVQACHAPATALLAALG
jgi:hypothetical protein